MRKALIALLAPLGAVYWRLAPENADYPFFILSAVSQTPNQDELTATAETEYVFQLDVYARSAAAAEDLRDAAYTLVNRPGEVFTMGEFYVANCRVEEIWDNSELEMAGSESTVNRWTIQFRIKADKEA